MVGVAGTITTVAAGVLDLPAYDRDRLDQAVLPSPTVHAAVERLVALTVAERRALAFLHPGRADVIGAGALILDRVLRRAGVDALVVSRGRHPRRDRLVDQGHPGCACWCGGSSLTVR